MKYVVYLLPKSSARNLGVIFDECCNMVEHVNKICKTSCYHLRNISKIRKYLTEETTEILVHAFVSSKLDYCNSLLYGLPKHMISSLQSVRKTAARIVTLTKKFDHITPVLIQEMMLDIVLNENENRYGIPKWFGRLIVALACFSFLVSLLQMAENKLDKGIVEQRKCLAIIRNLLQIVCVNFVFMVIRLDIFIKYKKEESIFIAKNGIAMYVAALEIYSICRH